MDQQFNPINPINPNSHKIIWPIVAAIIITALIVGGGVWWWQRVINQEARQTLQQEIDNLKSQIEQLQQTETDISDWKTYRNEEYGFEVTLTDVWNGYRAITKPNITHIDINFQIPTKDTSYGDKSGYATPFIISIYPISEWQKKQQEEGPSPIYINQNNVYVFSYSTWQDQPLDFIGKHIDSSQILSTFKFIE